VVLQCNGYEIIDLGVMVPCQTILDAAKEHDVSVIGLSGLITPSLDEMVHVAKEMKRQGFQTPLLIGGATTSEVHTAVKIEPNYEPPVVYVTDASRAVGVTASLLSDSLAANFITTTAKKYDEIRVRRASQGAPKQRATLRAARRNGLRIEWRPEQIHAPNRLGVHVLDDVDLRTLVPYIDWTPFFRTWELKGSYPKILEHPQQGDAARQLFADAQEVLEQAIEGRWMEAKGVLGLFPAERQGDDIVLFTDELRDNTCARFHTLRQQGKKSATANLALADFIAPAKSGLQDYIGAFAVTAGLGLGPHVARFEAQHDDYTAILLKALADRFAEAFAEYLHARVRLEFWGYAQDETLKNDALIDETYRGIRPAPGYPACPDHSAKQTIFSLLEVEQAIGAQLTESFAMLPAASVSGLYFAHPESKYFGVGKIDRDQVKDYADRRGISVKEAETALRPSLSYDT